MKTIRIILLLVISTSLFAQKAENKTDEKGRKQGYWEKINPATGRVIYKGTFKDDKPVGTFKYYYTEIDTIHTLMQFTANPKIAYATLYYNTGKLQAKGKYLNEQKDSVWTFYDESGKLLSSENYKEGKKNGKAVIYYQNGDIAEERFYKMDNPEGTFKLYYEGKKIKGEGNYENGKLSGKNAYYYPSGIAASMGNYNKAGNKHGLWLFKDKDGKVTEKEVYDNGKKLNSKEAEEWLKTNKPKTEETKPAGSGKTPAKTTGTKNGGKK